MKKKVLRKMVVTVMAVCLCLPLWASFTESYRAVIYGGEAKDWNIRVVASDIRHCIISPESATEVTTMDFTVMFTAVGSYTLKVQIGGRLTGGVFSISEEIFVTVYEDENGALGVISRPSRLVTFDVSVFSRSLNLFSKEKPNNVKPDWCAVLREEDNVV